MTRNQLVQRFTIAAAFGFALSAAVAAGPMPTSRRIDGILAADLTLDSIFLARDLNCDGDASDVGEVTLFLSGGNASGLAPTGAVFGMAESDDGTVYLCEADTDTIYAARDLNNDGDAMDAGEVRVFFSVLNTSGYSLPTPNGVAIDAAGFVYVTNAGIPATPLDAVFRLKDLNGDGDANDQDEHVLFVDETAIGVTNASPFECAVIGNTVHFIDTRGSATDVILSARDADNNNSVDAAELGTFYNKDGSFPFPLSLSLQSDGVSLYTHESSSGQIQTVWRLTDTNGSGGLDQSSEGVSIWSETSLPSGAAMANSFNFTFGPSALALCSNGSDNVDEIILARDLNGDGEYNDAGGTSIYVQGDAATSFPENLRYIMFYATPCAADANSSGGVSVQDIFDYLGYYFANDSRADINRNCSITVQDIFDFLGLYFQGC